MNNYNGTGKLGFLYSKRHTAAVIIGALCLFVLSQANRPLPGVLPFAFGMHHPAQFALLIAGAALILWGMSGGIKLPKSRWQNQTAGWILVTIMLLGFAARIWRLDEAVHLYVDEGHFGGAVTRLWDQADVQILTGINPIASFTWVYPYLQSGLLEIFGRDLLGLRMLSVILGTLTIPAVYRLGKILFDTKTALFAALLLATFPPHIHFSRLALNNIADPLIGTLMLAALLKAHRSGERHAAIWAGFWLGITPYFYEGGRLLFPALAALLLIGWRGRQIRMRSFLLTTFLLAMPYLLMLNAFNAGPAPRLGNESLGGDYWLRVLTGSDAAGQIGEFFGERLLPPLLHLLALPDGSAFYYGGNTGLILLPLIPAFLAGVILMIRHWKRGAPLLLWIVLALLGNSLIKDNTWTARYVVIFPALMLLTAPGLVKILEALRWKSGRAAAMIGGGLAIFSLVYYFGPHLDLYNQQIRPFRDHQDAAFRARDAGSAAAAYLLTDELVFVEHAELIFRLSTSRVDFQILPTYGFPYETAESLLEKGEMVLFIAPDDASTLQKLEEGFGEPLAGPFFSPYNVPAEKQYAMYRVSR